LATCFGVVSVRRNSGSRPEPQPSKQPAWISNARSCGVLGFHLALIASWCANDRAERKYQRVIPTKP
jgi:hypothetical protein